MDRFFEDYLKLLGGLHTQVVDAIQGLPQEALDWQPGSDILSICVFVTHLTGAERYWIGDVAGKDPSDRDRDAEFRARDVPVETLTGRLHGNLEYARDLFETLSASELSNDRISARDGKRFSVVWALLHALEHTALHLGHVQIIRQLWDSREEKN
jgi:hypothetical protein